MIRGYAVESVPGALHPESDVYAILKDTVYGHAGYVVLDTARVDIAMFSDTVSFEIPEEEAQAFVDDFQSNPMLTGYLNISLLDPIPMITHAPAPDPDLEPDPNPDPEPIDPGTVVPMPYYTVPTPSAELPRGSRWPLFAVAGGGLLLWLYLRRRD